MAVASILCPISGATLPDGSSGNAAPGLVRIQGTESNPKKHFIVAQFDAATAEHLWWTFALPTAYASGGAVNLLWMANAVTGTNVVWAASLGAITGADTDTPIEHANAAASTVTAAVNTTEARRLVASSITLANLDSASPGDLVNLLVYRDAANGSDTLASDAELVAVAFEFTS